MFFVTFGLKKMYCFMLVGSESGCLVLKNQACGIGGIAKISFRKSWNSHDFKAHFSWFCVALWPIFMMFAARLENLMTSQVGSGVTPDSAPRQVGGKLACSWALLQ